MRRVTVVFLDGSEEVFEYVDYRVRDGVLVVWKENDRRNESHFPLASIRTWRVER